MYVGLMCYIQSHRTRLLAGRQLVPVKVNEIKPQQDSNRPIDLVWVNSLLGSFLRSGIDGAGSPITCLVKRDDYEAAVTNGVHSLLTVQVSL